MRIRKFKSTTAFVAIDLPATTISSGPVRLACKVLQGGAKDLARSQTYTYAVLGMELGGASAGVSAEASERDAALAAFVAETKTLADNDTFLPDAAKGVNEGDLEALRDTDPRDTARFGGDAPTFADRCESLSSIICAESALGGLDGRTITVEGAGAVSSALVAAGLARGAKVLAGPHDDGTAADSDAVFGASADVVFVGSKMGVINHVGAERLTEAAAVVPWGRLPITAKALASLRRAGVAVAADFVALAGSSIALWGDAGRTEAEIEAEIADRVRAMSTDFMAHDDGPFLAACYRAEDFLATWQDTLPFGRPLAP